MRRNLPATKETERSDTIIVQPLKSHDVALTKNSER